jgi:hypothetical protein
MSECDVFWNRVVADHRPRQSELGQSEAQLAATEAPPLSRPHVEAICARVLAPLPAPPARSAWRRSGPRLAAAAVLLVIAVGASAWVAPLRIWPEKQSSLLTTTYEDWMEKSALSDEYQRYTFGVMHLGRLCNRVAESRDCCRD